MSQKRRIEKLEALGGSDRVCNCDHEAQVEAPLSPSLIEISRHAGPTFPAWCSRCGGVYQVQIIEVVVGRAEEQGGTS